MTTTVKNLAQLAELDRAAPATIVTVEELPALAMIHGMSRWTNRFAACRETHAQEDNETIVRARNGQIWARLRDIA